MPYDLLISAVAEADISRLSPPLQNAVESGLRRLAENPVELSRRSAPPAELPGYQVYSFVPGFDGDGHRFTIFFTYGEDEQTLKIHTIGHVPYA